MSPRLLRRPIPPVRIDPRYALLTAAYLMVIYWMSSLPDLSGPRQDPLTLFFMNLGHLPLFAFLALCVVKTLKAVGTTWWPRYALAFAASAASGALDEWHQSFVPGRCSSVGDFLVDVLGIGAMLVLLRLGGPAGIRNRLALAPPAHAPCTGARR
jgi:VanZ family protein